MVEPLPKLVSVWLRVLLWTEVALLSLASLTLGLAVLLVIVDEAESSDPWDGLGTIIGIYLGLGVLPLLAILSALLTWTLRARRTQQIGAVIRASCAAALLALLYVVAVVVFARPMSEAVLWGWLLVPGLLLLLTSGITIFTSCTNRATHPRPHPTTGKTPPAADEQSKSA